MSREGPLEVDLPEAVGNTTARQGGSSRRPAAITFGIFCLDLRGGRLLRGSEPIPLRPKTWAVLEYLAERPGVLVTKHDLLEAVWPDVAITESVLSKSIREVRVALGDNAGTPRFIETVPRRGFRFIGPPGEPLTASSRSGLSIIGDRLPGSQMRTDQWSLVSDRAATVPFVGRAEELQRLASAFTRACGGEPQTVFITGPPGIGKTAVVQAFLDSPAVCEAAAPVWVARGACIEQHGPREAYGPVIEALERLARGQGGGRLAGLLRRVAPTWLAQMPWLIGAEDEHALRQSLQSVRPERMLREFAVLIEELTSDEPLVLVLEDLQWSDASTSTCCGPSRNAPNGHGSS